MNQRKRENSIIIKITNSAPHTWNFWFCMSRPPQTRRVSSHWSSSDSCLHRKFSFRSSNNRQAANLKLPSPSVVADVVTLLWVLFLQCFRFNKVINSKIQIGKSRVLRPPQTFYKTTSHTQSSPHIDPPFGKKWTHAGKYTHQKILGVVDTHLIASISRCYT